MVVAGFSFFLQTGILVYLFIRSETAIMVKILKSNIYFHIIFYLYSFQITS